MKTRQAGIAVGSLWLWAGLCIGVFGQGNLAPPGPPGPTLKTLQQVEPRVPINALPFSIDASGSYYLATNLAASGGGTGITVRAGNVTLDLGGFTLAGTPGTADGIFVDGIHTNLWIGNGTVASWNGTGVNAETAKASQFVNLRVVGNEGWGLNAGEYSTIRSCTATGNGSGPTGGIHAGYHSLVLDCVAVDNRDWGIQADGGATVRSCVAVNNSGRGIEARDASTVSGCTSRDNGWDGFTLGAGVSVQGCTATANGGAGFEGLDGCVLVACSARSNVRGIVLGSNATIQDCSAFSNVDDGIFAGVNATVTGCSAMSNPVDGFNVGVGSTVANCSARDNGEGIQVGTASTIRDCTTHYNNIGITVPNDCYLLNNTSHGNWTDGMVVSLDRNRIEGNNLTENHQYGLTVGSGSNIIFRNTARGNWTIDYNIVTNNTVGQIYYFSTGGVITNSDPWANFSY